MSRSKQPKRIKVWVNEYGPRGISAGRSTAGEARTAARELATALGESAACERTAVPLIELRRGEVVVDVEALVGAFERLDAEKRDLFGDPVDTLRAALKKVGVR